MLHWLSDNCEDFRDMQTVRFAKCMSTMIGPDGHLHRRTAPRKNVIKRVLKINASTKRLVERLCDLKIYAVSVQKRTLSLHLIGKSGHSKHSLSNGAILSACVF